MRIFYQKKKVILSLLFSSGWLHVFYTRKIAVHILNISALCYTELEN